MILLVYKHREKNSYVALFSYCTFVATAASIAQQLHTIVLWDEIKTRQFYYLREKVGNPEIVIAGPSYGLDLILFYIQYYFYNVEGILILVWAFALAFSIFDPSGPSQPQRVSRRFGVFAKTIAFLQPGLLIGLLQAPVIRKTTAAFLVLADFNLAISLTLGSVFIVAVLIKYIQTRRRLHRWTIRIPPSRDSNNNGGETGQDSESEQSIYDGWLVVRFIIALLFIEAFQILTILSGFSQANNSKEDVMPEQPDLSAARAVVDFVTFIPGVSIGLLVSYLTVTSDIYPLSKSGVCGVWNNAELQTHTIRFIYPAKVPPRSAIDGHSCFSIDPEIRQSGDKLSNIAIPRAGF
ncbi:hypothetical protein E0Z10_g680 [Xylaria hypoxylon]|uniref:Uncharacterized protein n=1 Tax=Xylaria hypoxylon TaxID=37992 RepID=A0A4Z0Z8F2_9PEZI|nr:hypothetical protein E0Z10_g680 [Xylaria hypoxylon]